MKSRDLIAVIPAAGQGSRMGTSIPKLFLEVQDGLRICDILLARVATVTWRVHLVLSPEGLAHFEALGRPAPSGVHVTCSVQQKPHGMGDAVFGAREYWCAARHLLIVWGDQLGVSAETLARTAARQCGSTAPSLTLPLVHSQAPYVHYELDAATLLRVAQAREGDECPPHGLSDVGTFALSTEGLDSAWQRYSSQPESRGARTGELNLLPFFAHLARREAFALQIVEVADAAEARGVNTPEDLAYFRQRHL
jgi:bifunctional UDP-N-acetylglucosamine pyrophosphorylase / glucosamine-1-phosphate N-acetyltransferase